MSVRTDTLTDEPHKCYSGSFFIAAVCEMQAAVSILKERMVHIEKNKKLYKYLERGKGDLRHQRFSAPVPRHIHTDGMVRGFPVCGNRICRAAAPFHD